MILMISIDNLNVHENIENDRAVIVRFDDKDNKD